MLLHQLDKYSEESLTPEGLCNLIEYKYQKEISDIAARIRKYLDDNNQVVELSDSVSELVHMLFSKLWDEVNHLFKKETMIIFPCIKHHFNDTEKIIPTNCVDNVVYRNIQGTQKVILSLIHKLRQVLDNYTADPKWSKDWKDCLNEMFTLENKIYNWLHLEQNFLYPKVNN
jgi:iron-sulfur cluster repair protein YtfE (RIC family)